MYRSLRYREAPFTGFHENEKVSIAAEIKITYTLHLMNDISMRRDNKSCKHGISVAQHLCSFVVTDASSERPSISIKTNPPQMNRMNIHTWKGSSPGRHRWRRSCQLLYRSSCLLSSLYNLTPTRSAAPVQALLFIRVLIEFPFSLSLSPSQTENIKLRISAPLTSRLLSCYKQYVSSDSEFLRTCLQGVCLQLLRNVRRSSETTFKTDFETEIGALISSRTTGYWHANSLNCYKEFLFLCWLCVSKSIGKQWIVLPITWESLQRFQSTQWRAMKLQKTMPSRCRRAGSFNFWTVPEIRTYNMMSVSSIRHNRITLIVSRHSSHLIASRSRCCKLTLFWNCDQKCESLLDTNLWMCLHSFGSFFASSFRSFEKLNQTARKRNSKAVDGRV